MRFVIVATTLALLLAGCSEYPPKPTTNAQKCAAIGGTYNPATKTCQFQGGE